MDDYLPVYETREATEAERASLDLDEGSDLGIAMPPSRPAEQSHGGDR